MNDDIEAIFDRWKTTMGHHRARLDVRRAKAIRAMLAIGYSVDDLELAIFGCSVSPFHQGQNDRGTKFEDIALICRDAEHVDKFIALAEKVMAKRTAHLSKSPEKSAPMSAQPVPAHIMALIKG